MKLVIKGKPVPLARPRLLTGHHSRVYDPQATIKQDGIQQLRLQNKNKDPINEPILLDVSYFMPIPNSLSKKKKEEFLGQKHSIRPDLSNLVKMTEDLIVDANIITDDARITTITAVKVYSDNPRTELSITKESYENSKP